MTLDTRSLVYVNVAVFLVLGLAMLFIWRIERRILVFIYGYWVTF